MALPRRIGYSARGQPTKDAMRPPKHMDFNERRKAAVTAKQSLLEKFKAQPGPDDPTIAQKQAERLAIAAAREVRAAERRVAKEAEARRQAEEAAARAAEKKQREAEAAAALARQAAEQRALLAQQKAARDQRYAARKARR
jgi:hypothetical protein